MLARGGEDRLPSNNDIVRAIGDAIVQAAEYVNKNANDYSKSSIKNARIYGNQIKQNSVPGFVLKDGSIPGLKIVDLDFAKIKNVEIGNAHIANAGIDYAKIKDLHADSAYFGSQIFELGLGDELYIGRLRVNAANIAHLEVGELILESPDGTLYRLGVDEDGNVVTSVYEVQYQNIADMTKNLMSQYTIYRGTTAPETPYVGQLWVNTDTDIIKRCIAVTPDVIWEPVKASELHTSFINAVERGLEILSTGVIDVKNGGNINVQSGGSLNVKASGSVVVESGGQIQLQSSDAITIGGYPMDVGGENLLIDTSDTERSKTFSGLTSTSLHDISPSGIELIKAGGRFSLRAYIKNISGSEPVKICVYLTRSGSPSSTVYGDSNAITSGQNGYVVVRFNAPADTNIISGYVALQHTSSGASSSTVEYKRVKLESGNVSTSWSPSSYDTSSALASLNSVKNRIWYQPGVPTSSAVNDIWYDTDADPVKIYRANAANVSAIVTSGNGWYDITSVALDQALKGLNSLGNGSYHFFQSSTRPKSAGESGGSQINIGDIWLYTGTSGTKYVNGATYRAVSTNPTTDSGWLAFVAGAVLTPHIALNANHLTLSGESDLTVANPLGGNAIVMNKDGIAIESGSDLTIKDGSGGNVINMDNTGLTISSTGQLNLQSTDSIIIGGSPFSVGGTNLLVNSGNFIGSALDPLPNGWLTYLATDAFLYENDPWGYRYIYTDKDPSATYYLYKPINHRFYVGEKYTLSFYTLEQAYIPSISIVNMSDGTKQAIGFGAVSYKKMSSGIYYYEVTGTVTSEQLSGMSLVFTLNSRWFMMTRVKLEKGTMATDWSPSPQDTIDALTGIGTQITGLQTQIDGKIDTYFGSNDPSSGWTSAQKAAAVGDMWYNSTAKKLKRWNGASWDDINDQTAIDAYAKADTAQDTADGKRRVFVSTPVPPYDIGDLWAGGSSGDLKRCSTAKAAGGAYAAGDWVLATKYTDDTAYNTFVANTLPGLQARMQVFYQASKPTYTAVGDLWYDTDSNPLEIWRCTDVSTQAHTAFTDPVLTRALSAASSASNAAAAAQGTANSKINTFVGSSTPTALAAGDLWLDTGNKNIWKRATAAGTGGWVQYLTAAGYVNSTGITIDGTDLTVKATGNLNLASDGNLNVQNGGNLNVLNGGDIEINNGGDINVASGGKINITTANDLVLGAQNITAFADGRIDAKANSINLTANESIKLAVSGGTNLLLDSGRSVSNATYNIANYFLSKAIPSGTTVTMTLKGALAATKTSFGIYNSGGTVSLGSLTAIGNGIYQRTFNWEVGTSSNTFLSIYALYTAQSGTSSIEWVKLEKGTMATDWSPAPSDPASGVKTSSVEVNSNGIYMDTTGTFNVNAGVGVNIKGGSGASSIGISNNDANNYFMWAGHGTPASAPFSVKRDGSVKATKIQHEMPYTFWDMADGSTPAEFPVYIPSGYTIDSVTFTFQTKKARTFAKTAASGGGETVTSVANGSGNTGAKADFSTEPNDAYTSGTASPSTDSNSDATGPSSALSTALSGTGATGGPSTTNTGAKAEDTTGSNNSYTSGTSSPGTSTDGSHYHTITNHRHQVTLIPGSSNTVNTTYTQPGATTDGSHSHTVNSHSHSIGAHTHSIPSHSHTLNSHTHAGPSHDHGMAHTHNLGGHSHTVSSHSHSIGAHSHTIPAHYHSLNDHTHDITVSNHSHGINYGINEKSTLATSCALKVGATTIGTYSPNPSNPVELRAYMSAGWNTVIVAPNNDARIVAFALVKLTPD